MAWIVVTGVTVDCPNPAPLNTDFSFQVSFNCIQDLELPLTWRLVYVGDAEDLTKDQELESIELGPIKRGQLKFTFESDPPDFSKIDPDEIWGTTVLLLEASYRDQDFVRIGWYVHNYYTDPVLQEDPPDVPLMDKLMRYILVDEPRVTQFNINWTGAPDFDMMVAPQLPGLPRMPVAGLTPGVSQEGQTPSQVLAENGGHRADTADDAMGSHALEPVAFSQPPTMSVSGLPTMESSQEPGGHHSDNPSAMHAGMQEPKYMIHQQGWKIHSQQQLMSSSATTASTDCFPNQQLPSMFVTPGAPAASNVPRHSGSVSPYFVSQASGGPGQILVPPFGGQTHQPPPAMMMATAAGDEAME